MREMQNKKKWKKLDLTKEIPSTHGSSYLLARDAKLEECQKDILYELLGPVFFGKKAAETEEELAAFFGEQYGIDVRGDFYEGDEHYEDYREAQQAIAEGMVVYEGSIEFDENVLAELAEQLWDRMEQQRKSSFRKINTLLEE